MTCLLRNLYAGQEAAVRTGRGTTDWFQIGKGVRQAIFCHPAYLTYGRKQRRTKKPLDENERGKCKSWLKTQHSENEDHGIWSHRFIANR